MDLEDRIINAEKVAEKAMFIAEKALDIATANSAKYSELDDKLSSAHKRITEIDGKLSKQIEDLDKRMDNIEITLAKIDKCTHNSSIDGKAIKVMIAVFGTIAGIMFPALGALFK